ncbi:MAG TPA: alpha-glucan family phosphorylase [Fimbriimonadaceae bacterium]|nr:alpha-glucan family phosphorylase [Fimbriimonadaceae bacterium]
MKHPKFSHAFEVVSDLPNALTSLEKLARNFRWTWHHETRDLFRSIDKALWDDSERNPVQFLTSLSREKLDRLAKNEGFMDQLRRCEEQLDEYLSSETWFDRAYPGRRDGTTIAYFCFEFGLTEGLPIYSGGLGVLAGDHLKAASDLGIPLVGVGLLYSRGYFRQSLNHEGWQQEVYPKYDFYQMPLELMRDKDDQPIHIEVEFPDRTVTCQVWKAQVGRIPLYLLDSNVLENALADQNITDSLYGGDEEMRIRQEIILGIGGMRALRAVGINPTVCHMNEGHAAFLSIERIRQFMADHHCDFRIARQVVVSGNVFTTHTPVPAGFDLFTPALLERYMGKTIASTGLPFQEFVKMGRVDPENQGEAFNMAVLAMENANHVNGVSKLHASVSRSMFQPRWPDYPEGEIPIQAITNGVHTMTWIGRHMARLFDEHLGTDWRRNPENPEAWRGVRSIPDIDLWRAQEDQRGVLVRYVRKRLLRDVEQRQQLRLEKSFLGSVLDPRILTIGFARRFATYKRASLMLTDKERLLALLNHKERPIQILISGKAHPRDDGGKALIQELVRFINNEGARSRMVFIEDYDMGVARAMVQGVDVWLNNPRRPMEASGTSGMKAVPNGGLNCSILDGWWDEAYDSGVGFCIGDRFAHEDVGYQDWLDSRSLYQLIETDIAPKFYHRVDDGLPTQWIQMMKRSIAELAPVFSTARMVRDYTSKFYMQADETFTRLSSDGLQPAREALDWRDRVRQAWSEVRVRSVVDTAGKKSQIGKSFTVKATVHLGKLTPQDVAVEAVSGKIGPNRDLVETTVNRLEVAGQVGEDFVFEGSVLCDAAGYCGYTVRVLPTHRDVHVASELNLVSWEGR